MTTAAGFRKRERAPSAGKVRQIILTLAADHFLSQTQLASLLDRSVGTLRNHYLRGMIKAGELELRFPDPNHPRQAYRTKRER
jgi:ATP-dependent DNA helicase RecG